VVGDGASRLADTLWDPRLARRLLTAIAPLVEGAPIETLVNTHSDGDPWWGNQELQGAEIIATESAKAVTEEQSSAEMKRFRAVVRALRFAGSMPLHWRVDIGVIADYAGEAIGPFEFDEVRLAPPTRTFSGELELDIGGREVRLIEVGPAHTPGDLIVWVPDARIALAADILFIGVTPIMWVGPLERWIAALERLLELGAERFVPGHGPICGPEDVRRLLGEDQRAHQHPRPAHLTGHHPATPHLAMTDRDQLARLPQIALRQLARTVERALERPLDHEPRPDLAHVVVEDRLAALIAQVGRHLAQPQRRNRRVGAQLFADPVLEQIELRSRRHP
jgi:glyoxylase-like metal-dependent hydrolase (beta-lactamase superfamily II)